MWFGVVFWGEAGVVRGVFGVGLFSWMVVVVRVWFEQDAHPTHTAASHVPGWLMQGVQ